MRLCNSSDNCCCRLISLLDGFFRFLKHPNKVFIFLSIIFFANNDPIVALYRVHHVRLSPFFYQLYSCIFFVIFTNGIIDVMLHCYCISFTRRLIVDLKFFASVGIIFQLRFQIIVRTCAFMIW